MRKIFINKHGLNAKPRLTVLIVVFALITVNFVVNMVIDNKTFYYDASAYWNLAISFWGEDGVFSLNNYPITIRGYVFPFLIGVQRILGLSIMNNEFLFYRLLYSIIIVVLLTLLLPRLLNVLIGTKRWIIGCLICVTLFWIFWKDLLLFPLSDMFAFATYAAVILLLKWLLNANGNAWRQVVMRWSATLLAGALVYITYNTRTVYQIPLCVALLVFLISLILRKQYKKVLLTIGVVLGMLFMALPQMVINHNLYNRYSPMVITAYDGKENLFVAQLEWGMSIPRYETYIGDLEEYPSAGLRYESQTGKNIVENNNIDSIGDYVKCVLKHPFEVCGIYFEHFISGITLFYRDLYIRDIRVGKSVFALNCAIYLLALCGLLTKKWSGKKNSYKVQNIITIALIVFPAILAMPGALETRFFLPIYLLVYIYISMILDYRELWDYLKRRWCRMVIIMIAVTMMWCMVANGFLCELEWANLDFSHNIYMTTETQE